MSEIPEVQDPGDLSHLKELAGDALNPSFSGGYREAAAELVCRWVLSLPGDRIHSIRTTTTTEFEDPCDDGGAA